MAEIEDLEIIIKELNRQKITNNGKIKHLENSNSSALNLIDGSTNGDLTSKLNSSIQNIKINATQLDTAISDVKTLLGNLENDLYNTVTDINTSLGGQQVETFNKIGDIKILIDNSEEYDIKTKLIEQVTRIKNGASNLLSSITSIDELLGSSGNSTFDKVGAIINKIDSTDNSQTLNEKIGLQLSSLGGTELKTVVTEIDDNLGPQLVGVANNDFELVAYTQDKKCLFRDSNFIVGENDGYYTMIHIGADIFNNSTNNATAVNYLFQNSINQNDEISFNGGELIFKYLGNTSIDDYQSLRDKLSNCLTGSSLLPNDIKSKTEYLIQVTNDNKNNIQDAVKSVHSLVSTSLNNSLYYLVDQVSDLIKDGNSTISSKVSSVGEILGDGNSIYTEVTSLNTSLGSTGTTSERLNSQIVAIRTDGSVLETEVTSLNTSLGGTGTTSERLTNINSTIDGIVSMSGITSFLVTTAASISNNTVTIVGDDGSGNQSYYYEYSGAINNESQFTLTNVNNSITFINSSGSPITSSNGLCSYLLSLYPVGITLKSNISNKLTSINSITGLNDGVLTNIFSILKNYLKSDSNDVISALNVISTLIIGNSNFTNTLYLSSQELKTSISDDLVSLDSNLTVMSSATTSGNVVSITLGGNLYSIEFQRIGNVSSFEMTNNNIRVDFTNRSSSAIGSCTELVNYLNSMYPIGSKLSLDIKTNIDSINTMLGGSSSSVKGRIGAINRKLLNSPTGVVNVDIGTLIGKLTATSSGVIESDINNLAMMLTDTPSGVIESDIVSINGVLDGHYYNLSIKEIIGSPINNSSQSNLVSILGGDSQTISLKIGDPVCGTSGLAGLIKNNTTVEGSSLVNTEKIDSFNNATNIHDQLVAFIDIFNDNYNTSWSSLAEILSNLPSTQPG